MTRNTAVVLLVAAAALLGAALSGCQGSGRSNEVAGPGARRELPQYEDVSRRYNERTDRLPRLWARAVVSINFRNEKGERRSEQGEGHLQMIRPSRLALSVGKLGEVLAWIGCDEERYWLIDPKESRQAFVGRHELMTPAKVAFLGIPAAPRDLIRLFGAEPLPAASPEIIYGWAPDGEHLIVEERIGSQIWRYLIDEAQMRPVRIELLQESDRTVLVSAALENYEGVSLRGVSGYFPQIATRITATQPDDGSQIRVSLAGMNDGGGSRLADDNFDFESLKAALGVSEVVDLDASVAARQ